MNSVLEIIKKSSEQKSLQEELLVCPLTKGKKNKYIEVTLKNIGIYSLNEVLLKTHIEFFKTVERDPFLSAEQKVAYRTCLETVMRYHLAAEFEDLRKELDNVKLEKNIRNKIHFFLMQNNVDSLEQINILLRERFIEYLEITISLNKVNEYVKALDKAKLESIHGQNDISNWTEQEVMFKEEKIFLLYYPDYKIAERFYYVWNKENLIFDFSLNVEMLLKRQIFSMLKNILLKNIEEEHFMSRYLVPLKKIYLYAIENKIADIFGFTIEQMKEYKKGLVANEATENTQYVLSVSGVQKYLFLTDQEVNWDANTWYIERFGVSENRLNPARPIVSISFLDVKNVENREKLKFYTRKEITNTKKSLQTIRMNNYNIKRFLKFLDEKELRLKDLKRRDIETYMYELSRKENTTFNDEIASLKRFLHNCDLPNAYSLFYRSDYKHESLKHNNRIVSKEIINEITENLGYFPEDLRLIMLHLLFIPVRISELCILKANSYRKNENGYLIWIRQSKMKAEKEIPIPEILYEEITKYIKMKELSPNDYIFGKRGDIQAKAATIDKRMKRIFLKIGISPENYNFQSHDFRHTVLTNNYDSGTNMQFLRAYAGHRNEEMTMQYIDYPEKRFVKKMKQFHEEKKGKE